VQLLTNGFDEADFKHIKYRKPSKFTIRHVGVINEKCDPRPFMQAVLELSQQNETFRSNTVIEFVGEVHPHFREYIISHPELTSLTIFHGNIPHATLVDMYGSSSLLLIILHGYKDAEGFMPGKLFEYLATGLQILGVGPVNGDAACLLKESKAGEMFSAENIDGLKRMLLNHFNAWREESQPIVNVHNEKQYSRKSITGDLAKLLFM
jgi:hypothetical protein